MKKIILLLAVLLAGCATSANYEKLLDSWTGSTESALVATWGPPSSVYELDGTRYLTFNKSGSGYIPGVAPTYQTKWVGNTPYTTQVGGSPGYSYATNCNTTFILQGQVIKSWRYEGNACRSY